MTRQLLAVFRVTFRSTFGISAFRWRYFQRRERLWELALMVWGIGTAVVFFGYGLYRLALAITTVGLILGQPEIALGLASVISQVLVLLMGFFMIVSAFYFARDLRTLVPLPVSPGVIVTAKFLTLLVAEYITIAFVFLPALLAYWRVVQMSVGQVLVALLVFLLLPVLPLAIGALVSLVLMRGINRRHRDIMLYASTILFLGLLIAWQMAMGRLPQDGDIQRYLEELISSQMGLARMFATRFPPALWATIAVAQFPSAEGLRNLAYTIGSAVLAVLSLGALGNRLFYRGLIGSDEAESSRGRRGPGAAALRRRSRTGAVTVAGGLLKPPSAPLAALVYREWALLSRTPIWMLNNVLPALLMPVFMLVPLLAQSDLRVLVEQLTANPANWTLAGMVLAAFMAFVASVSGVAPTAISREGGRFWISRTIPQPATLQLRAKLILSLLVVAVTAVPTVAAFALLIRPPMMHVVLPTLLGLLSAVAIMSFGLRVDAARPMLNWQEPQEPVKRNLNAIIPMIMTLGLLAVGGILGTFLVRNGAGALIVYGVLLALVGGAAYWAYRYLMGTGEAALSRLEP